GPLVVDELGQHDERANAASLDLARQIVSGALRMSGRTGDPLRARVARDAVQEAAKDDDDLERRLRIEARRHVDPRVRLSRWKIVVSAFEMKREIESRFEAGSAR